MELRNLGWAVAVALALSPALVQSASALDCNAADCTSQAKPSKPLDIMKFMREQAASTRTGERSVARHSSAAPHAAGVHTANAHVRLKAHAVKQARSMPTQDAQADASAQPAGVMATAPTAPSPDQQVQEVASDEFNAIDAAAPSAPAPMAETVGSGSASQSDVPLVSADEFNDVDRKAAATATSINQASSSSWLGRVWSALTSTFTAFASAVHHLIA